MSLTNFREDACYLGQQETNNKSIFNYVTDTVRYQNKNKCKDFTPPFISYNLPQASIDIENDLKGMTRNYSKCTSCNFKPQNLELSSNGGVPDTSISTNDECQPDNKILPGGYIIRK